MGAFEVLLGVFALLKWNNPVLVCLMISLFIYQICLGTYTWVYIAEIGNDKNQALGSLVLWGVVQSLVINYMFDSMGDSGTFWFFGGCSIIAGVIMLFVMKETKGLTQEQAKVLYVPKHLLKVQNVSTIDDPRARASYDHAIGGTIISRGTTSDSSTHTPLVSSPKSPK